MRIATDNAAVQQNIDKLSFVSETNFRFDTPLTIEINIYKP